MAGKNRNWMVAVFAAAMASGCIGQQISEPVSFVTPDGFEIKGMLSGNPSGSPVLFFSEEWRGMPGHANLTDGLAENHIILSADLRGYGESVYMNGTRAEYPSFTDDDYGKMVADIGQAKQYLSSRTAGGTGPYLIGAGVGANAAVKYAAFDPGVRAVVLISPGMDYHGLNIKGTFKNLPQPVLVIVGSEDSYSAQSARQIVSDNPSVNVRIFHSLEHGTALLSNREVRDFIEKWMEGV